MPVMSLTTRLTRRGALLALAAAGLGTGAGATRPSRPLLRLGCPAEAPDGLCRDMLQALAAEGTPHVFRQVSAGEQTPQRPGDIGVGLLIEAREQDRLIARLTWQSGPAGARKIGPRRAQPVKDPFLCVPFVPPPPHLIPHATQAGQSS